jgi:hypothetical protein
VLHQPQAVPLAQLKELVLFLLRQQVKLEEEEEGEFRFPNKNLRFLFIHLKVFYIFCLMIRAKVVLFKFLRFSTITSSRRL